MTRVINWLKNRPAALLIALVQCLVLCVVVLGAPAQTNLPPAQVYARAYAGWSINGQQANTYTFNGMACNYTPYNVGTSPSFFVFSGSQNGSTVYFPVLISDANPALSEVVTPTSTVQTSSTCGFAASTVNQHTTFTLTSGTGGLQEAIASQTQNNPPVSVLLDQFWYNSIFALPSLPTPEAVIKAAIGNNGVQIVDTTTSPWTYWRWNNTAAAYQATSLSGGSALPTVAAGAAAGTSPTISNASGDGNTITVSLTSGTATTAGTLFTETWATSSAFLYPPVCRVWSSGTTVSPAVTTAVTYPSGTHALLTVSVATAPAVSTAYQYKISCS